MARSVELSAAARALLASLVDYAGLFPPAGLPMADAAAEYARWRRAPESWLLGRFVVPAARLDELLALLPESAQPAGPWPLSALFGPDAAADAARIAAFDAAAGGRARVDSVESKAGTPAEAAATLAHVPAGVHAYVELPLDGELEPLLSALRARGARAKVRTGGLVPEAIPDPSRLARFVRVCATAGVPFKATAGLHHPLRSEHPLTYAQDAPRATMHGFLNLFAAAALARAGSAADLEAVLREERPSAFRLDDEGLAWRQERVTSAQLAACRSGFAVSFGSCSFAEPVADLRALGVIP